MSYAVILDFGQIARVGTSSYEGYGANRFGRGEPFTADADIVTASIQYAEGWFAATSTCPKLLLGVGLSNYEECANNVSCDEARAGYMWAWVISNVEYAMATNHWDTQITIAAADDIETSNDEDPPGSGRYWDDFATTKRFIDGYNVEVQQTGYGAAKLLDFGDAWTSPAFTVANTYYAAYGGTFDWPFPENYNTDGVAASAWKTVRLYSYMNFLGVMTECGGVDPLPTTSCGTQNAPNQAWTQIWNRLHDPDVFPVEASLDYSTNIQTQP